MVQKSAPLLTLTTTHTERQEPLVGVQANSASRQSKQLVAEGVGAWPPTRRLSFRLSSGPSGLLPVCLPLRWLLILDAWTSNADLGAVMILPILSIVGWCSSSLRGSHVV